MFLPSWRYASEGTSYGSVSVCLSASVTSRYSIETAEWIELAFGLVASFHLSYAVLKGNSGISKNKGTFLFGTLSQTQDLANFA